MKSINESTEVPVEIETSTDPDDSHASTYVDATVIDVHGTNHTASCRLDGAVSDEQVAAMLLRVVGAAAQLHSSGAWMAVQRMLADPGGQQ
jgi:hypothetical protein